MRASVQCPNPDCRKTYPITPQQAGRKARCKVCGTEFVATPSQLSNEFSAGSSNSVAEPARESLAVEKADTQPGFDFPALRRPPERLGRFQISELLGTGAFGAVYLARDPQLDRDVALKVLQRTGDEKRDRPRIDRFLIEGRAAARLQHPNIVPVFDAGRDEATGEYYQAAAFIRGEPLSAAIDGPMDPRRAATIVRKLAEALDYAHRQGILHRDVKPDNVMLDEQDEPHLMDFGLARIAESEEHFTKDETTLGTAAYMSPEQAARKHQELTGAADQYSLGCLLYELLTGQTPFSGPAVIQIHLQLTQEPDPPSKLTPVSKDLETICLKTLAKEQNLRYSSCATLADDLRNWLEHRPVLARRLTPAERLVRWCRREPVVATLSGGLLVGLLAASTLAVIAVRNAGRAAAQAERADKSANEAIESAKLAEQRLDFHQRSTFNLQINRASQLLVSDAGRALELLQDAQSCPESIREFAWGLLYAHLKQDQRKINLPGPALELFSGRDTSGAIYRLASGGWFENATKLQAWSNWSEQRFAECVFPETGVGVITVSGDGRRIAWGAKHYESTVPRDQTKYIRVWNTSDGSLVSEWSIDGEVQSLSFSQDGETLASVLSSGRVDVWNVSSKRALQTFGRPMDQNSFSLGRTCVRIALSPDAKLLAARSHNRIIVMELKTGKELANRSEKGMKHDLGLLFSPDQLRLTTVTHAAIQIWNFTTGALQEIAPPSAHDVQAVTFLRDGTLLASAGRDRVVRVWDVEKAEQRIAFQGHTDTVTSLRATINGKLMSGGADKTVRYWSLEGLESSKNEGQLASFQAIPGFTGHVSDDGRYVVISTADEYRVEHTPLPAQQSFEQRAASPVLSIRKQNTGGGVSFGFDGRHSVSLRQWQSVQNSQSPPGSTIQFWDLRNGKQVGDAISASGQNSGYWMSPSGRFIASESLDFGLIVFDGVSHHKIWNLPVGSIPRFLFSPDDKQLLIAAVDRAQIDFWDTKTWTKKQSLDRGTSAISHLCMSVDGSLLAAAAEDASIKIWDLRSGERRCTITAAHGKQVGVMRFAPDNSSFISTGSWNDDDHSIRLWDPYTGHERLRLLGHQNPILSLAFSEDGFSLLSASQGTLGVWRSHVPALAKKKP